MFYLLYKLYINMFLYTQKFAVPFKKKKLRDQFIEYPFRPFCEIISKYSVLYVQFRLFSI